MSLDPFAAELAGDKPWPIPGATTLKLSIRELQALRGLSEGKTLVEVASDYGISWETVKDHMSRARLKLGAATNAQAVFIGCKKGIL